MDAFMALADRLADAARDASLKHFRSDLAIDAKADSSPVTVADREVEAAMRTLINDAFPDHGIFGEEHGNENLDAEYVWVLDPIDGTASFVTGKPLFGTLIALLQDGKPVIGVIDVPALDERWRGCQDRITTFNGRPVRARACGALDRAWLLSTSPDMFRGADAEGFGRLSQKVRRRVFGGDCYNYGVLASGNADLVCEADLKPYDYCALVPVIEGAGGIVTDWSGAALDLNSDGRALASGDKRRHGEALALLNP